MIVAFPGNFIRKGCVCDCGSQVTSFEKAVLVIVAFLGSFIREVCAYDCSPSWQLH